MPVTADEQTLTTPETEVSPATEQLPAPDSLPGPAKPGVVFFGNERLATGVSTTAPTLRGLIGAGYDVKAVISSFTPGTSRSARRLEVQEIADAHNIPVLLPGKLSDIKEQLVAFEAEIGILVAFGQMVPESIINLFPRGIVNIHPSLLPLHRGPTPIESAILEGADKTGVSIMQLVKAMDTGPVYGYAELPLSGSETKQELADTLLEIGKTTLLELLPGILDGSIAGQPQDDLLATYDHLLSKDDGIIDWNKPARQLEREVRAYHGWPKSRTTLGGKEVIVTKAHVAPDDIPAGSPGAIDTSRKTTLLVATSDGWLGIDMLKPAGKGEMTAADFLRGYGDTLQ